MSCLREEIRDHMKGCESLLKGGVLLDTNKSFMHGMMKAGSITGAITDGEKTNALNFLYGIGTDEKWWREKEENNYLEAACPVCGESFDLEDKGEQIRINHLACSPECSNTLNKVMPAFCLMEVCELIANKMYDDPVGLTAVEMARESVAKLKGAI